MSCARRLPILAVRFDIHRAAVNCFGMIKNTLLPVGVLLLRLVMVDPAAGPDGSL